MRLPGLHNLQKNYLRYIVMVGWLFCVSVALLGCGTAATKSSSPAISSTLDFTPTSSSNSNTIGLPPSQTPTSVPLPSGAPAVTAIRPESCGPLTYATDGNVSPVTCPDGKPNLAADSYFRAMGLGVLKLGSNASLAQVQQAACADRATLHTTVPVEENAYKLAAVEERWHFAVDPSSVVGAKGGC